MVPGTHAFLSPSGASRWLTCPPSARLEEHIADSSNDYADEGTLAHSLAEILVKSHFGLISQAVFKVELATIKRNKFYNSDMESHCLAFLGFIVERHETYQDAIILAEQIIDLADFIPGSYGTLDNSIISPTIAEITDLKYGKGVFVDAKENKQMMLYALGLIKKYVHSYGFKTVRMNIFQPRLNNYSSYEMTVKELLDWGEAFVIPRAQEAFQGKGKFVAGEHCKFCRVRFNCKALADHQMEIAQGVETFPDAVTLDDKQMARILEKAPFFISWLSDITDYALREAIKGKKWPGFKLVEGRSNRRITSELEVIKALKKAKIDSKLYLTEPALIALTKLETALGHDLFTKLCAKWIDKPKGSPTLVPATDKRLELSSNENAAKAFENIKID